MLLATITLLTLSVPAAFAASVTITPAGNSSYSVKGDSMDGVAGIDLTIIYDSSSLSTPTVTQGSLVSGALMAANTNNPGSIKIAIISTKSFSGSGEIATVSFTPLSGSGGITSASVNMINSKGSPVTAQVAVAGGTVVSPPPTSNVITTAGIPFSQTAVTTTAGSSTTAATTSIPTYLGSVSMPGDVQAKSDKRAVDTPGTPVPVIEQQPARTADPPAEVKPVAEPQKQEKIKSTSYTSVLESFRMFKGVKSPDSCIALYTKEITPSVRQEPAIALSDGKTVLNLRLKLETTGDNSPNFFLNGAKMVSLSKDASLGWVIVALPKAGAVQSSLTVMTDSDIIEYPLTLAPPVGGVSAVEADFAAFLADSGAAKPKHDLNGDGKHDYIDDFIYTANYLMKKGAAGATKR